MVPSNEETRIVGCLGGDGELVHDLMWFNLSAGRKHCCAYCGQVYMLDNPNWKPRDPNAAHGHGHGHGHGH